MNARLTLPAFVLALLLSGCAKEKIQKIRPALAVSPTALDFAKVKVGDVAEQTITLSSQSQAAVAITSATLHDGSAPGGAAAFELVGVPRTLGALTSAPFAVRFRPDALQAYGARLTVASDDPQRPTIDVPISGEGAQPILQVIAECLPAKSCKGTAASAPPSIDFGEEPLRAVPIPVLELPTVTLLNAGEVTLAITRLALEGAEPAAFKVEADLALKDRLPDGRPALLLPAGNGVTLPIRFQPFAGQSEFTAALVIESDDPTHAQVRVGLEGKLGANQPPRICANIVSV